MANDIIGLIDEREALEFGRSLTITRNYLGDQLFPDRKTQYLEAEYDVVSQVGLLPTIAPVHAFDTEAVIGERPAFGHMEIEKLLMKKKINQSERLRQVLRYGMSASDVKNRVFDDMAYLFDAVKASSELRKMTLLGTGSLAIVENNLDFVVDYGVPAENKVSADWSDPSHDIMGDIQGWVDQLSDVGAVPDLAVTSNKIVRLIAANEGVQKQIFGAANIGAHVSLGAINDLFRSQFSFGIVTDDEKYAEELVVGGKKVRSTARFFPETSFSLFTTGIDGSAGVGLWGVTPEEERILGSAWDQNREQLFVTLTQWSDTDPVAVWSKGSGLFVPALPDPTGLLVATITASTANIPVEDIEIFGDQQVAVGETIQLEADIDPTNATVQTLAWASSNEEVATVSSAGVVTGVAAGYANISASATDGSGVADTINIQVTA